jgi:hypothetical protein
MITRTYKKTVNILMEFVWLPDQRQLWGGIANDRFWQSM